MAQYIAENEIEKVEESTRLAASGQPMIEVTFKGEVPKMIIPKTRFDIVVSDKKEDATIERNKLVRVAASRLYAICVEHGLKLNEVDVVINAAVNLMNDAQEEANKILWNISRLDERTLIDVNDILKTKYNDKPTESAA